MRNAKAIREASPPPWVTHGGGAAASFVVSLPVLAAGFAAQDELVQGLSMGAVK